MKTQNIIIAGLLAVAGLSATVSCTKLEDKNYTNIMADGFQPSDDDVAAILSSAYVSWRKTFLLWNGVARAQMLSTDEDIIPARPNGWVDGGVYQRMHQHRWTTEDDIPLQSWVRTYDGINACNRVLYQIESGQISLGDSEKSVVSELKTLRASYYYILVDLFGNVPLVTKFDVEEGYLPVQSKRSEVYEFIVKELEENIPNLTEDAGKQFYGRFNKWAGYTLLAKMYLNSEVFSDGTHNDVGKVSDICDKVMNSGKYALESTRRNVFVTENENSSEIIFALPFDEKYITDWNAFDYHLYTLAPQSQATYNFQSSPWGGVCAIPQYINTFDEDDQRLTDDFIQGPQYDASGNPLMDGGEQFAYVNEITSLYESTHAMGFRWGKFEYAQGITNRLSNDFPLLRYADVYLMKAEGLLRTGNAEGAAKLVSEVRARNFKSAPEKATVTAAQLQETSCYDYGRRDSEKTSHDNAQITYGRMLDELGWEFSQEGRRRQDMIRFNAYTTLNWFSHDKSDANKNLYPIPHNQILANQNLKQNPGY